MTAVIARWASMPLTMVRGAENVARPVAAVYKKVNIGHARDAQQQLQCAQLMMDRGATVTSWTAGMQRPVCNLHTR